MSPNPAQSRKPPNPEDPLIPEDHVPRPEEGAAMEETTVPAEATEELTAETLIEEVSIDGMCGVY
ncbi:hypothetical protein GCM10023074_69730 [Microbispora amethystogenes]|uniref:Mycofactocin n=1 Tax=Microbispora amethystogenes TaxID=1427754 RepID=A0ABQ4FNV7_9ACTN|nr:hypothetical protein Mam01_66640 [Microbispora amethystogenes]